MSSLNPLLPVILAILNGVFSEAGDAQTVSVLEEDCFTLHTNVTEIDEVDLILWMFGLEKSIIAKLNGKTQVMSLYDVDDGRFGERLELDNQTGSLTLCEARTKHSGDYELKIISSRTSYRTFSVTVYDVFFAGVIKKSEGETVTLQTGVGDKHKLDLMVWTFGPLRPDSFLAELNTTDRRVSYGSDERFRERLQMDDHTGSLRISSSRSTDSGLYQIQISSSRDTVYRRYSLIVAVPGSALTPAVVKTLVSLTVLLLLAVIPAGCYFSVKHHRLKHEPERIIVAQGDSVTLNTGVTKPQMVWRFGPRRTVIAQMPRSRGAPLTNDERFRDRLQMDDRTGDLTIRDVRITHSGDYQMCSSRGVTSRTFRLILCVYSLRFSEGETVRLDPGLGELEPDDQVTWSFGSEKCVIAGKDSRLILSKRNDERFGDRLQVNPRTGSLTITNTKSTDSGVFHLRIKSKNRVSYKNFRVTVWLKTVKVSAGDSVTLNSDLTELEADCKILWTQGEKDTCIAKFIKSTNKTSEYRGDDMRFRDRLRLDPHTGSLTIFNVNTTHSDVYKLQIISHGGSREERIALIVEESKVRVPEGGRADLRVDDLQLERDALVLWTFGPEDTLIAKADLQREETWTSDEGRFTHRLELERHSGSLSLTAVTHADAGLYKLKVFSRSQSRQRRFRVSVSGGGRRETQMNGDVPNQEGIPLIRLNNV